MSRRVVLTCALLAGVVLMALGTTWAGAAQAAAVPAGFVGVNLGEPDFPTVEKGVNPSNQFAQMVSSGVENVRVVFNWAYAQPYAHEKNVPASERSQFTDIGGVPTRFSQTDAIVALAAARGMTVLPTVLYAPAWDDHGETRNGYGRPARDAPYAAYLTDLVKRYGPHGTFWAHRPHVVPITEWQIWNEEDGDYFWPTHPFAKTYVALLAAAHKAVTQADPQARIVLGGLAFTPWKSLATIYAVKGASSDFNLVSVHPYTAEPSGVITILSYVRQTMDRNGGAHTPILADEISWTSGEGQANNKGIDWDTTPAGQAHDASQIISLLAARRTSLGIGGFDWFSWVTRAKRHGDAFSYSGLLNYTGTRVVAKPALAAYRKAALAIEDCRSKGALATDCTKR